MVSLKRGTGPFYGAGGAEGAEAPLLLLASQIFQCNRRALGDAPVRISQFGLQDSLTNDGFNDHIDPWAAVRRIRPLFDQRRQMCCEIGHDSAIGFRALQEFLSRGVCRVVLLQFLPQLLQLRRDCQEFCVWALG